jgi:hypothetical protein
MNKFFYFANILKIYLQTNNFKLSLQRQVLHDQLLQNPPGWEHSKGMWL